MERKKSLKPIDKKISNSINNNAKTETGSGNVIIEKLNRNSDMVIQTSNTTTRDSATNDQLNNSYTKQNLDDSFRKTFSKKEKIEIDCEPKLNKSVDNIEIPTKFQTIKTEDRLYEFMEVFEFLEDLSLAKYYKSFIDNGFDTLEKLKSNTIQY